ncbi:hypothetical protein ACFQX6_34215 [Streptosporangium lutulentum]
MSQVGHVDGFEEFVRTRFSQFSREAGLGENRYAEAFQRVSTV